MRRSSLFPTIATLALALLPGLAQGPGEENTHNDGPAEYVIGVEDVLKIVTWGEADLTLTATVRPDGRITIPLVNDIVVAGMTPNEVRRRITAGLSGFVKDPNVTVIVEEINSFRVYFLGEIVNRGPLQFYRPTRLLQGIATAGGLTDFAKKEITILREGYGVERRIEVNYKKLWSGDPGQENLRLKPGDTVLVN